MSTLHARRDVDERTARPDSGVERGELVVARRDHRREVLLEDVPVLAQAGVGVDEDDTLLLQVLADLVVDHFAFVLRGNAGDEALLLGLGDAEAVVGVLDVRRQVLPRGGLLLRRADEVLDVLEVDPAEVTPPRRHWLAVEQPERLQAQVEHPLRLVLEARDVADDVLVEATPSGGPGSVGIRPAVLIAAEPSQAGVELLDIGHDVTPFDSGTAGIGTKVVQTC
jgi:hypothetical protein